MQVKYPSNVFFECIKCGLCCRDDGNHRRKILLTPLDVENIVKATRLASDDFCRSSHSTLKPFDYIMKKEAGSCLFLDGNSMCRIYDSRPIICRCYPFSVEFESSNTVLFASSKECPSIGNGVMMRKKFFEKLAAEVKNNLKSC